MALGEVDLKLCNAEAAIATLAQHLQVSTQVAAESVAEAVEDSLVMAAQAHAAEHGLDLPKHVLVAFGGAAPLRAAHLAERLGIETVLIPPDASVGSAVGFFSAPLAFEAIESYSILLRKFDHSKINAIFRQLWHKTVSVVAAGAARWKPGRPPKERRRAYLRYVGQGQEVCVDLPNRDLEAGDPEMLQLEFESEYNRLGFIALQKEEIEFRAFALEVVADADPLAWPRERLHAKQKLSEQSILHSGAQGVPAKSIAKRVIFENQQLEHLVYSRSDLQVGDFIPGPAVICEPYTTTIFSQYFDCWVLENGFLQLQAKGADPQKKQAEIAFSPKARGFHGQENQESPEHTLGHRLAWTRLLSIVEEQARTTLRNAFSTLLRECRAVGCAVLSASGELLAHSETSSPSLTGVLLLEVQACLLHGLQNLSEGECMIRIRAGCMPQHSDLIVLTPVFKGDDGGDPRSCGYIASTAHVRKMACSSCVVNRETVSKMGPDAQDVAALMASNELGLRRLLTLFAERSVTMASLGRYILKESRSAIFRNLDFGEAVVSQKRITLETSTAKGAEVHVVELTAELQCSKDGLNVKLSAQQHLKESNSETPQPFKGSPAFLCVSFCKFALMAVLGQGIPVNTGSLEAFHIQIPAGSILDAEPREGADASQVAYFLPDLLFHCLSSVGKQVFPTADSAACLSTLCWNAETENKFGLHVEGGGLGAQSDQDGLNSCIFPCGLQSMPVEITEMSSGASMSFNCKELIADSGGAGCFRGGLGVRWELMARRKVKAISIQGCCEDGPSGKDGGLAGKPFATKLKRKQGSWESEQSQPDEHGEIRVGDVLVLETPGGGGYGPPAKRSRESLLRDVEEGYVSHAAAVSLYKLEDSKQKESAAS